MNKNQTATQSAIKVLDVLERLCGFAATGVTNCELSNALQMQPAAITRAVDTLIAKGWARKDESSRYYPSAQFTRLTFRVLADFDKLLGSVKDQQLNMTRSDNSL